MQSQDHGDQQSSKIQSVTITVASIFGSVIHAIIGYIAVYFFKPIWEKIMNWRKPNE